MTIITLTHYQEAHMNPPVLEDDILVLRSFNTGDVQALYEAVIESRRELAPWMPWCHAHYSRADSEEWIAQHGSLWQNDKSYPLAVFERDTGMFVGGSGLNNLNHEHNTADLGYWVRSSRTGRGYATRAALMSALFALDTCGFIRVQLLVAADNAASRRVADKAGARYEGVLRNRLTILDTVHDTASYSFIPADLPLLKELLSNK